MFTRTNLEGYIKCCRAIANTDFRRGLKNISIPTLLLVGDEDGSTPPDLVRATSDLISDSKFEIIKGAGHLPCVEKPEYMAVLIKRFLIEHNIM
jgi:3-oxoadipate enol-lactonase